MRRRRFVLVLATIGLQAWLFVPCVGRASPETIVAATLIAKFKGDYPIGRLVRSVPEGAPRAAGELEALLAPISVDVGVPLEPVRVTSGGELVLQIPRRQALEGLASHIGGKSGVEAVTEVPDPSPNPFRIRDRVRVEFAPDSAVAERLAQGQDLAADEEIRTLVGSLLAGTPYVAEPAIKPGGVLDLVLDWEAVTRQVVTALRSRDDIEYVQAEAMLVPFE